MMNVLLYFPLLPKAAEETEELEGVMELSAVEFLFLWRYVIFPNVNAMVRPESAKSITESSNPSIILVSRVGHGNYW